MKTIISLQNGVCALRHKCENVNAEVCKPLPKKSEGHISCRYFKRAKNR